MSYNPRTTYLEKTPWIRLTYLFSDGDADRLGFGVMIFSCTQCGDFKPIKFEDMGDLEQDVLGEHGHPLLRAERDRFQRAHVHESSPEK